jgi:FtsP/CotA-like multicopper oxidase with cupredoxin domain
MYPVFYGVDALLTILILVTWWITGNKAGRLVYLPTQEKLRRQSRQILVWLCFSLLLVLGKIGSAVMLYQKFGWVFAQDRLLLHIPILVILALATTIFAIPRIITFVRLPAEEPDAPLTYAHYHLASAIRLLLPLKAATLGAVLCMYFFLAPTVPMNGMNIAMPIASCLAFIVYVGLCISHRHQIIHQTHSWMPPRKSIRLARGAADIFLVLIGLSGVYVLASEASYLPDRISMMSGKADYGKGIGSGQQHSHNQMAGSISVEKLTGPWAGEPDRRFTLTAEYKTVQLDSGVMMEAWTFNGQLPGPELRMQQGELVEVTLINKDIEGGATVHWHGLDVPNAEDGVAGVTQNAVLPGETYTYRFIAEQAGTYWYHSHQHSAEAVKKGLFGALIVGQSNKPFAEKDITVMTHTWKGGKTSFGSKDDIQQEQTAPGTPVRLRLINTDDWVMRQFAVVGTPFKVVAIDGTALHEPTDLTDTRLQLTTGGRYDITFTMPDHQVFLSVGGTSKRGILFSQNGSGTAPNIPNGQVFSPVAYGSPQATLFDSSSTFDREFNMILDNKFGFYNGSFGTLYTINGELFPHTPMYMVKEGDLVKTTITNRGMVEHPMHLHGHHMLVLSRNGLAVSGSPWWSDTLSVAPGESYVVAFRADNPGIWMDHCHNLTHAVIGMSMHLAYEGVTSPFETGDATHNHPE